MSTDKGAEAIAYPDGGVTPFRGGKLTTWDGGLRAPLLVRWPGDIEPGRVKDEIFSALDRLPTPVDIAGGPKGDGLKTQIEAASTPVSSRRRSTAASSANTSKETQTPRATATSITPACILRPFATRAGSFTTQRRHPRPPAARRGS